MLPKISIKFLKSLGACKPGIQAYIECGKPANLFDVLDVCKTNKNVSYGAWLITKLLDAQNNVRFAIYCAELVLPLFEGQYKEISRPRKAIESAKVWLSNQDSGNVVASDAAAAAYAAAYDADDAADATTNAAAYAAAAAAYAAVYAAVDTTNAAYAANAAAYAVRAAANAAHAAVYAAAFSQIIEYAKNLLVKQYDNV